MMYKTPKLLLLSLVLLLGTACKSTKTVAWTPVGTWDYTVSNTPNGDISGVLIISGTDGDYEGEFRTEEGNLELTNLKIEEEKITGNLNYQGYELSVEGVFTGDMLNGEIGMGYDSFTFKASRE